MIPGAKDLPIEIQFVFWILIILIGAMSGLIVWFIKKHLTDTDARLTKHEKKLSEVNADLETTAEAMKTVSFELRVKFADFVKEVSMGHEYMRRDVSEIRRDLSTATLRTIAVNDNIEKARTETAKLATEMKQVSELHGKVKVIESDQSKIVTVLQKLNERLVKVSQKKD